MKEEIQMCLNNLKLQDVQYYIAFVKAKNMHSEKSYKHSNLEIPVVNYDKIRYLMDKTSINKEWNDAILFGDNTNTTKFTNFNSLKRVLAIMEEIQTIELLNEYGQRAN